MVTPAKVKQAAQYLIDMYGDHVEHLGQHQGAEAFYYHFPDEITAGLPHVFLLKDGKVMEVCDFDALDILNTFVENLDE